MTREEIIKHLHKALDSVDITFPYRYVFVEAIEALSNSSLPSDIDDVAKEYFLKTYGIDNIAISEDIKRAVKFGIEWMAGQGETIDGEVVATSTNDWESIRINKKLHSVGDRVVVQIRKKQ